MNTLDPENDILVKNGYLFFWGGWPSNWEPSPFLVDGIQYNCVEQFMMAEKAKLFGDEEVRTKILASPYPKAQKEFGRKVRGFDKVRWDEAAYKIVVEGSIHKYLQNSKLQKLLLATTETFVEASPEDSIWGIGMLLTEEGVEDPKNWRGTNLLGRAITEARTYVRRHANR
jgi:ribA/ribD-fused uncharacterized protein